MDMCCSISPSRLHYSRPMARGCGYSLPFILDHKLRAVLDCTIDDDQQFILPERPRRFVHQIEMTQVRAGRKPRGILRDLLSGLEIVPPADEYDPVFCILGSNRPMNGVAN